MDWMLPEGPSPQDWALVWLWAPGELEASLRVTFNLVRTVGPSSSLDTSKRSSYKEKPLHHREEWPPFIATRESPERSNKDPSFQELSRQTQLHYLESDGFSSPATSTVGQAAVILVRQLERLLMVLTVLSASTSAFSSCPGAHVDVVSKCSTSESKAAVTVGPGALKRS
ncbi:hypothetical protein MJT46_017926 [Ovis ammon polii x Ovis aries]|nr:hypothetical protein MJT46_017926 [Ovis ammon polii x Ovis aries]